MLHNRYNAFSRLASGQLSKRLVLSLETMVINWTPSQGKRPDGHLARPRKPQASQRLTMPTVQSFAIFCCQV